MSDHTHSIQKMVFELVSKDQKNAYQLQNEVAAICQDQILPEMNWLFEQFDQKGLTIRIDKIEIDVGNIPKEDLKNVLLVRVKTALEKALEALVKDEIIKKATHSGSSLLPVRNDHDFSVENIKIDEVEYILENGKALGLFIHFLLKGYFPWWSAAYSLDRLESEITEILLTAPEAISDIKNALIKDQHHVTRLVSECSTGFIDMVFSRLFAADDLYQLFKALIVSFEAVYLPSLTFKKQVLAELIYLHINMRPSAMHKELSHENEVLTWLLKTLIEKYQKQPLEALTELLDSPLVWDVMLAEQPEHIKNKLSGLLERILSNHAGKDITQLEIGTQKEDGIEKINSEFIGKDKLQKEKVNPPEEDEAIYIRYAGLVLLHPFFKSFFAHCGLLSGDGFIDEEARQKALRLLDFLASGTYTSPEHELVLHKLICGLPVARPLDESIILNDIEKEEAESLLSAVIKHWKTLKNTSVQGFREAFMDRKGKLTRQEESWLLQVEKEPYDVLLDHLPWSIAMIKQRWNKYILNVEWY